MPAIKNKLSVFACDPGSMFGWAKCICTLKPELHISVTDHGTEDLNRLTDLKIRRGVNPIYSRKRIRLMAFKEVVTKLTGAIKYDSFVAESPFCQPNRQNAFKALVLYMDVLDRVINVERNKKLYTIAPKLIKAHISGFGSADKSLVQHSILHHPSIDIAKPQLLTEHSSDSVACCYAFIRQFLTFEI